MLAGALVLSHSSIGADEKTWVVAIDRPSHATVAAPLTQWAQAINHVTGGARELKLVQAAADASARRIKSDVRNGKLALGAIDLGGLVRESSIYAAADIPFALTSKATLALLFDRWRPMLEARLAEDGLRLVMLLPGAPHGLLSRTPVRHISDIAGGLPIAAPGAAGHRLVDLIGAPFAESHGATDLAMIASGALGGQFATRAEVDAATTPPDGLVFTELEGWRGATAVICSQTLLDQLTTPERAQLLAEALDIEDLFWQTGEQTGIDAIEVDSPSVLPVLQPDPELVLELRRIGARMAREWAIGAGADGATLIAGLIDPT